MPPPELGNEIEEGIKDLEDELYAMINSDNIDSPGDMDFTDAKAHFQKAVQASPSNNDARFGLGLTTLLALTSDQEIIDAFNDWEAYLENNTPFQRSDKSFSPMGVPLTFVSDQRDLELPLEIMAQSLLIGFQPKMEIVEPRISEVQDIIRDKVIPALTVAANHLSIVSEDASYVFLVTPLMQGDAEEDTLELDRTEILAAHAGALLLRSACRLAVAYDLNFPSYDAQGILDGLNYNTGNLLRLRSGGEAQMNAVETDFLAAVNALDSGITTLLNESDNQDNDIIKIGPDDLSRQELLDFQANELPDARAIFAEGLVVTEDWDNDYYTPDVNLRINAHNFFDNPIEDWKRVLPPYTVTTVGVEDGYHPNDYTYWGAYVISSTNGYGFGGHRIWVEDSQAVRDSTWGNSELASSAMTICQDQVDQLNWAYSYRYTGTVTVSGAGDLQVGYNYIDFFVDHELVSDAPVNIIPHITWEADTFEQWKAGWNNYDFNGLLPDINSTDQLFTTFGFQENDWDKEFDLDWTDLD